MAKFYSGLVDQWGRPIEKAELTREVAAPTLGGVRSPLPGYPGDGLDPGRLATILREADGGDPVRYMELAEQVEERFTQYLAVLGTRKRQVAQLEITVDPASDAPDHVRHADMVRDWLERDELSDELFDILDAIGKGWSFTEILWDTSEGQWSPSLAWRNPRWFRPDRVGLTRPLMLDERGQERELPGGKFITASIKAKSGLPLRSGLARPATWLWMFSAFTQRDWAIFTQNFGMPVRIGKYGAGATEQDKETLYRAVANIAGDMAAVIPESMMIEFIEAKGLGASVKHYEERADWLDRQASKLVLGQTATTDSVTGGLGSGKEHSEVREDIERADAKALAGVLNRDLVRVWVALEFGPQKAYPKIRIGRPETADVQMILEAVAKLLPAGLKVGQRQMAELIGIGAPDDDDELLAPSTGSGGGGPLRQAQDEAAGPSASLQSDPAADPQGDPDPQDEAAAARREAMAAKTPATAWPPDTVADAALALAPDLFDELRALVEAAAGYDALRAELAARPALAAAGDLTGLLAQAMLVAELIGRADLIAPEG